MFDLRVAFRMLGRSPTYSTVVIAVLALGISANVVVFGFYKGLELSPLSGVRDSAALLVIGAATNDRQDRELSYHDYEFVRDHATRYAGIAGTTLAGYSLGQGAEARRIYGELVTGSYFQVLGVTAAFGRTLLPSDDDVRGAHAVAVIADSLWRRRFASDPNVVGSTARVNGITMTIVGVLPPAFHGAIVGLDNELYAPFSMQPQLAGGFNAIDNPRAPAVFALARPRPGVTFSAARAELDLLDAQLARDRARDLPRVSLTLSRIGDWKLGVQTYARPLVRLMGGTALLLLVTVCSNVAALVLARCLDRRGDFAARLSLGASRARIVRLVVLETLLLAVPGALAGLALSAVAEPALLSSQNVANALGVHLYFNTAGTVLLPVAILLAVATSALCGIAPALRTSRIDLATALKDGGRLRPHGPSRIRAALVLVQITTAVVLLAGMTVAMRSFQAARRADPGFDPTHVTAVIIDTQAAGYSRTASVTFYDQLLRALQAMPHVDAAGFFRLPLLMVWDFGRREFVIEGQSGTVDETQQFSFNIIGGDHFQALRIPLVAGRDFARTDDATGPRVAIVNETLARRYWDTPQAALGRRVQTADWTTGVPTWMTIVGVARDIKYIRLNEPPMPYVYLPFQQASSSLMGLLVRSSEPRAALLASVATVVHSVDANVPVLESRMLEDQTRLGFSIYDVAARVLGTVGIAAVCLAALGVYGMVAYTVRQRLRDIGIRLALGAAPATIRRGFIAMGLRLGAAGVVTGIVLVLATARAIQSLLYGVSATDLPSLLLAAIGVLAVVAAAAAVPAWKASRMDPIAVLRRE